MNKHIFNAETGIGYTLQGDYYLPDLVISNEEEQLSEYGGSDI